MTLTQRLLTKSAGRRAAFAVLVAALCWACVPACAKPRANVVRLWTTWDDRYFYASFDVSDPDIQGSSSAPNAEVGDDDAVALYFEAGRAKEQVPGKTSFRMVVSAAGGAQFAVGDGSGWVQKNIITFKYAVRRDGTLNDDQDDDTRFQVEIAVPWSELGVNAQIGAAVGFNAVVQMKGENGGFVSLASDVTAPEHRSNPSMWQELWLRSAVQPISIASPGKIMCNKVLSRAPVVDGRLLPSEYSEKHVMLIEKPAVDAARHVIRDFPVERLVFGVYYTDFESGPGGVASQASYAHRPLGGFGPWFDPSAIRWHHAQLLDAQRAGLDVVLVVCDSGQTASADDRLVALAAALRDMAALGQGYPHVGLLLRAGSGQGRDQTWAAIRRFCEIVSPQFLAQVRLPQSRGGQVAMPVFARGDVSLSQDDRQWYDQQSLEAFGFRLIWIAGSDARDTSGGADGFISPSRETGWSLDESGWLKVGSVTPGCVTADHVLGRSAGETYASAWAALTDKQPDWVVVDSFNNWRDASEIAESYEYGLLYIDATAIHIARHNGQREYSAKFLSSSVPASLSAAALYTARFDVRNAGTKPWKVTDRVRFTYRWYQAGRLYSQGIATVPLQKDIPVNGSGQVSIGVAAIDSDKDLLTAGEWLLVFDLVTPDGKLFSSLGDHPLAVAVSVGDPPSVAAQFIAARVPALIMPSETYVATFTVRNDGTDAWPVGGDTGLVVSAYSSDSGDLKVLETWSATLTEDVPPGRIAEVAVPLDLKPSTALANRMVFLDARLSSAGKAVGTSICRPFRVAALTADNEWAPALTPPARPLALLEYGKTARFSVDVKNKGPRAWREDARLAADLYSIDGRLMAAGAGSGKLRRGIKPGESITANVDIRPPFYPGQYVLLWSVRADQTDMSRQPLGGSGDAVYMQYVTVQGPGLETVDLSAAFDTDVMASEAEPADGVFHDGRGSLPADLLPPLVVPTPAPSVLYTAGLFESTDRAWVSFAWPARRDGAPNAISAKGQTLSVQAGNFVRVHILAARAGEAAEAEFGLVSEGAAQKIKARVGDWSAPGAGDMVAYRTAGKMTPGGLEATPAYLYHIALAADASRPISGLTLPNDPATKVLAITLERSAPDSGRK